MLDEAADELYSEYGAFEVAFNKLRLFVSYAELYEAHGSTFTGLLSDGDTFPLKGVSDV
jgi:hypothetical protein